MLVLVAAAGLLGCSSGDKPEGRDGSAGSTDGMPPAPVGSDGGNEGGKEAGKEGGGTVDGMPAGAPDGGGIATLIPKTGVYVPLYMYPSAKGAVEWQKLIDARAAYPSVPIVATANPSTGPGTARDDTIATWVKKLQQAGVVVLGYTPSQYGARAASLLRADIDRYAAWYGVDGIFIDVFANKSGHEAEYGDLTAHAKSLGMKMTMGNPGTDVPQSYVGTVDVLLITEGAGYVPVSWLQYCVQCSAADGWHFKLDKRNFALVRYGIDALDTSFVRGAAPWVGLMYISDGTDADGRWFHVPAYFDTLIATLDK